MLTHKINGCLKRHSKSNIVNVVPRLHTYYNNLSKVPTASSHKLFLYAKRDIMIGEELIWDYNLDEDPDGFT